ncbi:unnamed protein product [Adineta steineri]|uniref:Uncharacterized protein n=1 Tax=Adineta steineri TaxID=433720 RepID=A0A818JHL3_9BILA|nr:unnamed protein product [Adineta steineri]CAF3544276.1 unnamed protein product [Adineta steineri]
MERKRKIDFINNIESDEIPKRLKKFTNESEQTHLHSDIVLNHHKALNQNSSNEIVQEQTTINFDDTIKTTQLNVDEKMEEEHFDNTKYLQWEKIDKDAVDWTNYKLKNVEVIKDNIDNNLSDTDLLNNDEDKEENDHQFNEINALNSLLAIMQPTETVVRAIKRLGVTAASNKSKQRIKQRKPQTEKISTVSSSVELTSEELKKNKFLLEEMTGLADQFVYNGNSAIYEETYEQLKIKLDHIQLSATNTIIDM